MLPSKKKWLQIYLVFILVFAACIFIPQALSPSSATVVPLEENRGNLTLIYPKVEGLGKNGEKINHLITQEIENFAQAHTQPDHSGQVGYKVEYNKNQLLSLRLKETFYVQKSAHPMSYQRAFTFNILTGELLHLADLFLPEQEYISLLNELVKEELAQRHISLLRPYSGISANQEFYLTPDALVIFYQLYEYTAYVYSFPELVIPYDQLSGLIRPELIRQR